ncbi:MAG: DUF624 domain-containing protein [Caldicoprobacter sp.]|uniref:YesL family protein n=1 Tax=Caldicoprobacter sp. TaxID=2004500 RepID=UPI001D8A73D7|nr:hypothetical protein [Clostridia bacterium]
MFGGLFERMYYGNPNKPDLKYENLREKPIKLFFTVLRIRFWDLIKLNLLYSLFWLPAFIWTYLQLQVTAQTGEPINIFYFLVLIPCLLFAGPATAGVTYVLRNWARDEHAWLFSDFKDAWKMNWKESLIIMLLNGLALMIFYVNLSFYSSMASQNIFFLMLYYFMWMIGLVYAMMNIYIFPMLVTYKLSVRQILKNALIFTLAKLPHTFVVFVLMVALFIASIWYTIPVFFVGLTFPMFIGVSLANWAFYKYLDRPTNNAAESDTQEGDMHESDAQEDEQ